MNTMNTYAFGSIQHTIKYIYDYYESPCLCPAALKLSQQDNQIFISDLSLQMYQAYTYQFYISVRNILHFAIVWCYVVLTY